jgi:hypothetical protein
MHATRLVLVAALLLCAPCPRAGAQEPVPPPGRDVVLLSAAATVIPIGAGVAVVSGADGSVGKTALAAALMWGGAIGEPSAGYVAGGRPRRAGTGLLIRAGTFALAWALAPTDDFDDGFLPNPQLDRLAPWLVAVPAILASAGYDVVTAGRRVQAAPARVGVLPVVPSGRTHPGGIGLSITASFPGR